MGGHRVTVFVMAVEEPTRGCAITQTQGAPAAAVNYDDGGRTMVCHAVCRSHCKMSMKRSATPAIREGMCF